MKKYQNGLLAVMFALNAYSAIPAKATEYLNIPFSAAIERHADALDNCGVELGHGLYTPASVPSSCLVDFPLTIPAGHIVKQVAVSHGYDNVFPNPQIQGWLQTQSIAAPYDNHQQFFWSSLTALPVGTVETSPIMAQFGKNFPDAFIVRTDTIYHVIVRLYNGATAQGLLVTYE